MRESTEVETQQLADCVILPSHTSQSLGNRTQKGTGMEIPPGHPQKAAKPSELPGQLRVLPQDSQGSAWPVACRALLQGSEAVLCGEGCATSAGVLLTEQSCKPRNCWGGDPEVIWASHLEVAAHKLCCTRDFSRASAAGEGQMGTPVTQPMLKSLGFSQCFTWSDLRGEIRTKQMLLAQIWLIHHFSGPASTTTMLRWLKKANRL